MAEVDVRMERREAAQIFLNPSWSAQDRQFFHRLVQRWGREEHFYLASSGTTSVERKSRRLVGLSRRALQASASSVNQWLGVTAQDAWFLSLPKYHIGGLALQIRAQLAGIRVEEWHGKWHVENFHRQLSAAQSTLCSLVPTQLYDLVACGFQAPPRLRAVLVGGAFLNEDLYGRARQLNWPILPTYGLSEAGSSVAMAALSSLQSAESPRLELLPHMQADLAENRLRLKSSALLSHYLTSSGVETPLCDGWYTTGDRATLTGRCLKIVGRREDLVKINGKGVNLFSLRRGLEGMGWLGRQTVVALRDARKGRRLVMVTEREVSSRQLQDFNEKVLPHERIEDVYTVSSLPCTELGKICHRQLVQSLESHAL